MFFEAFIDKQFLDQFLKSGDLTFIKGALNKTDTKILNKIEEIYKIKFDDIKYKNESVSPTQMSFRSKTNYNICNQECYSLLRFYKTISDTFVKLSWDFIVDD